MNALRNPKRAQSQLPLFFPFLSLSLALSLSLSLSLFLSLRGKPCLNRDCFGDLLHPFRGWGLVPYSAREVVESEPAPLLVPVSLKRFPPATVIRGTIASICREDRDVPPQPRRCSERGSCGVIESDPPSTALARGESTRVIAANGRISRESPSACVAGGGWRLQDCAARVRARRYLAAHNRVGPRVTCAGVR